MYQKISKLAFTLVFVFALAKITFAQVGQSPYSTAGLGELSSSALIPQIGMGGIGVSVPQTWYLNNMNPAFLHKNTFTTFESGVMAEFRRLSNGEIEQENAGGGIRYVVLGIPIKLDRWTMAAGWSPYSTVNYKTTSSGFVNGTNTPVNYIFSGSGGLNQAYIANGVRLNKNFSLGMRASYIFGNIINNTSTIIGEGTDLSNFTTSFYERNSFSDLTFQGSAGYSAKLNDKTRLNIGATYDISNNISGQEFGRLERQALNGGGIVSDTIIERGGSIRIPSIINGGFSIQKINKWTIGTEIRFQNWNQYRDFNGAADENLQNSVRLAIGGEFIPDISSVDNFFKRITYRAGVHFEKTPILVNGKQVNDIGINFGTSLPVWGFSSLNMALGVGQRGSLENGGIRDQYVKIFFGITFNDKPWIKLPKYD
jgi:hypothetical protein